MEISNSELEVMKVIWERSPCTAAQVIDVLQQSGHEWHAKTVKTLLSRLVNKGALRFEVDKRSYVYFPLVDQESHQANASKSFIDRYFGGRISPLISGFAKKDDLQAEDVEELKQLIENWEKNRD